MIEQFQALLVELPRHTHEILFFDVAICTDQLACDTAILRQDQQAGRIDVEPTGRCQPFEATGKKALRIARQLTLRTDQHDSRLMAILGLAGNITDRLVQQDRRQPCLLGLCRCRQSDLGIRCGARTKLRHLLAIDEHQPALDVGIGLAARTEAAFGHQLRNADELRIIHGHAF